MEAKKRCQGQIMSGRSESRGFLYSSTASNKFFLLPVFGLVVSLGLTINKQQMQFSSNSFSEAAKISDTGHSTTTHRHISRGHVGTTTCTAEVSHQDGGSRGWR